MILTLTVNPAIDRTITVDRLAFEDRTYILSSKDSPGGRGINASCVIHSFNGMTTAILPAGGSSGTRFTEYMKGCGFPVVVVPIRNRVRTNLIVTDRHGLTVKLNEYGPKLEKAEVTKIEKTVRAYLDKARWLMLCGSLPPGVPSNFYATLIHEARKRGVKTLLDTDGDALLEGVEARPSITTPNQQEAERLLNTALLTRTHYLAAAERICKMGAEAAALSLGARGAIGAFPDGTVEVIPPRVEAVSPIGAGDALAAAFLWAMENKSAYSDALRWGVAAGTASAKLPGMKFASLDETREVYPHVEVRRLA
jgi:1-phosphofructokinase family hexose kinase